MTLKTPLYDIHVKLGGKMVDFGGYLLPIPVSSGHPLRAPECP